MYAMDIKIKVVMVKLFVVTLLHLMVMNLMHLNRNYMVKLLVILVSYGDEFTKVIDSKDVIKW